MTKPNIQLVQLKPEEKNILKEILWMEWFDNALQKVLEHAQIDNNINIKKELIESEEQGAISSWLNTIIKQHKDKLSHWIEQVKNIAEEKKFPIQVVSMQLLLDILQNARTTLTSAEISANQKETLAKNMEKQEKIKEKKAIESFLSYLEQEFKDIYTEKAEFHISPDEENKIFNLAQKHFNNLKWKQKISSYLYELSWEKLHSVNQEKVEWNYILNKLYEKIDRKKPAPKVVRQKPLVGNAQYINSMDVISFDDIHQHKIYSWMLVDPIWPKNIIPIRDKKYVPFCLWKFEWYTDKWIFVTISLDDCKWLQPWDKINIKIIKKKKNYNKWDREREYLLNGIIEK